MSMNKEHEIGIVGFTIVTILIVLLLLFVMAFVVCGLEAIEGGDACHEVNNNFERLWPIRAAAWIFKPL